MPPSKSGQTEPLEEPSEAEQPGSTNAEILRRAKRARRLGPTGCFEWDLDTNQVIWSDEMYRLYGFEPGEVTPSPRFAWERTLPADRLEFESGVEARKGQAKFDLEHRILRPDGTIRRLRVNAVDVDSGPGEPRRKVGWVQDITEQHNAEREIDAHCAVSEALDQWRSLDQGAELLLAGLTKAMGFAVGVLWLRDDASLAMRALWHSDGIDASEFEHATRELRYSRGVGLPGQAWETTGPVELSGVDDSGFSRRDAAVAAGLHGGVAFPAATQEEVLGVVELFSLEGAELTEQLNRSLTVFGLEIGHFLANRCDELAAPTGLTARELQVLELAAQGLRTLQISERLQISPHTVKTHLHHTYEKLGASSRASAVATALRQGLIQ